MDANIKNIMTSLSARANQSRKFVAQYLENYKHTQDEAFIRYVYILLSYSFELALKTKIAKVKNYSNKNELYKHLSGLGHNLENIAKELSEAELNSIGISSVNLITASCNDQNDISSQYRYYKITTTNDDIINIEEFTDIRYGCLSGGMRHIREEEHKKLLSEVNMLKDIYEKIG